MDEVPVVFAEDGFLAFENSWTLYLLAWFGMASRCMIDEWHPSSGYIGRDSCTYEHIIKYSHRPFFHKNTR